MSCQIRGGFFLGARGVGGVGGGVGVEKILLRVAKVNVPNTETHTHY